MDNRYLKTVFYLLFLFLLVQCSGLNHSDKKEKAVLILPPEELYGELFYNVQSKAVFQDSKTFVDCVPKFSIEEIKEKYSRLESKADVIVLRKFITENFEIPEYKIYKTDSASIHEHIRKLWNVLKRTPDDVRSGTLIPLKHPYIVPGGRFREIYYWDSYFTMLGLQSDKETELIQSMVDNFSDLIDAYGFIPNGNRTYYLSRSQPPFYAMMISLLAEIKGDDTYRKYRSFLEREYEFWMNGVNQLNDTLDSYRRVVRLPGGEIMNRYWDDKAVPRAESYKEDIKTAGEAIEKKVTPDKKNVYRNLRAAAESGWDFSSRWLSDPRHLYTIHTIDIIPVDLNSLLYNLELTLARSWELDKDREQAEKYYKRAEVRKNAINKYCWNIKKGFYMDYDFRKKATTEVYSIAGVYPLWFRIADAKAAAQVVQKIKEKFSKSGGVVTTLNETGQQWDAPNGWAPLQWCTVTGLRNYNQNELANKIIQHWVKLNEAVYKRSFKMLEKYNVKDSSLISGGGEYPTQDGFGWTNGVYQKLTEN